MTHEHIAAVAHEACRADTKLRYGRCDPTNDKPLSECDAEFRAEAIEGVKLTIANPGRVSDKLYRFIVLALAGELDPREATILPGPQNPPKPPESRGFG